MLLQKPSFSVTTCQYKGQVIDKGATIIEGNAELMCFVIKGVAQMKAVSKTARPIIVGFLLVLNMQLSQNASSQMEHSLMSILTPKSATSTTNVKGMPTTQLRSTY